MAAPLTSPLTWRRFHGQVKECLIGAVARNKRLLDVGCGVGGDLWRWKRAGVLSAVGVDPDELSVCEAGRRAATADMSKRAFFIHTPDVVARLRILPGPSYEAITCMFAIQHVEDMDALLRECWRLLRLGGCIVLCLPDSEAVREAPSELVTIEGDRACFHLDTPYFHRKCAPSAERLVPRLDLQEALERSGFSRLQWLPFHTFDGFATMAHADQNKSRLYAACVALKESI